MPNATQENPPDASLPKQPRPRRSKSKAPSLCTVLTKYYFPERDIGEEYKVHLRDAISLFAAWLGREPRTSDLTVDNINKFLIDFGTKDGKQRMPKSINNRRGQLLGIASVAESHGLLVNDAGEQFVMSPRQVKRLRVVHRRPLAWSIPQIRMLCEAARELRGFVRDTSIPRSLYFTAWIAVAFETGLRPTDLRRIRRKDIDENGVFYIVQSKTGKSKWCRLRPETVALLDRLVRPRHEFLFGLVVKTECFNVWWKRILATAGLQGMPYRLRSSSGTAYEAMHPGEGHVHLGNARVVFERHYLDGAHVAETTPLLPLVIPAELNLPTRAEPCLDEPTLDLKVLVERCLASFQGTLAINSRRLREQLLNHMLHDMRATSVDQLSAARIWDWLGTLELAPKTVASYRGHLSALLHSFARLSRSSWLDQEARRLKIAIKLGLRPEECKQAAPIPAVEDAACHTTMEFNVLPMGQHDSTEENPTLAAMA